MADKRMSVDQALARADACARRGEVNAAADLYNAVLRKFPGNRRALQGVKALRGPRSGPPPGRLPSRQQIEGLIALYGQRRLEQALEAGADLARQFPAFPLIHNILGAVHADLGRLDEAVACYTRALRLQPGYAEAHNNLGNALNALGRTDDAVESYTRALQLKADYAEAHNNLGNMLNDLGRHEEALASLTRAVDLRPDFAEAHNNLGNALNGQERYEEALASFDRALDIRPDYPEAHNNRAHALGELGRCDEAIASFDRAVELKPDYAEAHNNLGKLLRIDGRLAEAEAAFRRAIEIAPDFAKAYANLADAHRFEPGDPLVDELTRQLAIEPQDGDRRSLLLAALGKAHDELGHYEEAFACYSEAKRERAPSSDFDPAAHREWIQAVKSAFPQPLHCADGPPDPVTPIFIVGMSRSGKTLVESLLAQHPAVMAGGESRELQQALRLVLDENGICDPFPACIGSMDAGNIREMGKRYLDRALRRQDRPGTRFHVNTLPGNYSHLGLIFQAFPDVRVVCCRREAMDQCLSIYFRIFSTGHSYSYDLQHLAAYCLSFQGMMAHWLRLYGDRILTVDYETLVRQPEETARRLYVHCGLDFPPADFHVELSTDQIGHARHYEAQLAPLREALGR